MLEGVARADESWAELIWSYPSDGMEEVPTNSGLIVVVPWEAQIEAWLDGDLVISSGGSGFHSLPPLESHTDYHVKVKVTYDEVVESSFSFMTGAGPAQPVSLTPELIGAEVVADYFDEDYAIEGPTYCRTLLGSDGCWDEGPLSIVKLTVAGDPRLWHLTNGRNGPYGSYSAYWPAECGSPHILTFATWAEDPQQVDLCFDANAFAEIGNVESASTYCPGGGGDTSDATETDGLDGGSTETGGEVPDVNYILHPTTTTSPHRMTSSRRQLSS